MTTITQVIERLEMLKRICPEPASLHFFTEDAETLHFIDMEDDRIEFSVTVTASCGCCSETEFREDSLTHFLEFMSDQDFAELLEIITSK